MDFSRTELIDVKGVPYYRWSYRRLTGPDGATTTVDAGSPPINSWSVMTRDVYRHYKVGTGFPSDFMGPMPTSGPGRGPAPNLFRIRPLLPPAGAEWVVLNESVDLATGYFETASLAGAPAGGPPAEGEPWPDDLRRGALRAQAGALRRGRRPRRLDGQGHRPAHHRPGRPLRHGLGDHLHRAAGQPHPRRRGDPGLPHAGPRGQQPLLRRDPAGGRTVTSDPVCGFHNYSSPSDTAALSFVARHPNGFAGYGFVTARGTGPDIAAALDLRDRGRRRQCGFSQVGPFTPFEGRGHRHAARAPAPTPPSPSVSTSRRRPTNGTARSPATMPPTNAAFALATPCPDCGEDGNP